MLDIYNTTNQVIIWVDDRTGVINPIRLSLTHIATKKAYTVNPLASSGIVDFTGYNNGQYQGAIYDTVTNEELTSFIIKINDIVNLDFQENSRQPIIDYKTN